MKKILMSCSGLLVAAVGAARVFQPVGVSAAASWVNVTGNLANMASECGNLTLLSAMPGSSNTIIAGVAQKGLWSSNGGTTWTHLGSGSGSATITNRPSWILYDPTGSAIFWESGIYNGGGVYKTLDSGVTLTQMGSVSHNDYVSVDFTDPNRQTLLAGGHEQSQTVYKSTNGGQTWTNIGVNLPSNTNFSSNPLVINAQTYLVNTVGWASGTWGVYRSTTGGSTWQQVSTQGPVGPPLIASNGTIYWPLTNGQLLKSTNSGVTWTQVGSGLQSVHPIELPNGNLVSTNGSTLMTSADGGSTWTALGPTMPYQPAGVIFSAGLNAFFIWHGDCGNVVPADGVMRFDYAIAPTAPTPPTGLAVN